MGQSKSAATSMSAKRKPMTVAIRAGDCRELLKAMPAESVQCVVTSPPYWGLRSYTGGEGMIGLEPTFDEHLANLVEVFREVRRVLRADGTCWLNYGDAYAAAGYSRQDNTGGTKRAQGGKQKHTPVPPGLKPKHLMMMPARVALALQADGAADAKAMQVIDRVRCELIDAYDDAPIPDKALVVLERLDAEYAEAKGDSWWVRSEIIWHKPNPMPESATDRPTSSHEKLFLMSKSGSSLFWTHRAHPGVRSRPDPDYVWRNRDTRDELVELPAGWEALKANDGKKLWRRVNLWEGHDYFYDAEAVRVPGTINEFHTTGNKAIGNRNRNDGGAPDRPGYAGANIRNVWTIATHSFSGWTETVDLVHLSTSQVQELVSLGSEFGGDICRIGSPDCLVHAGLPDQVPTGFCDGLPDHLLSRMRDSGYRPDQEPSLVDGDSKQTRDRCLSVPSKPDCSDPSYSPSAMTSSTGSRKTGHGPPSSPHAKSSGKIALDTGRTEPLQGPNASIPRGTDGSKSEDDKMASSSAPQTEVGTVRTSESGSSCEPCCCAYYRKVVNKSSHFATFPPKLVEPCILAGTSAKGCCSECGAPLVRVVDASLVYGDKRSYPTHGTDANDQGAARARDGHRGGGTRKAVTTKGWNPSCECGAETKPCVVLDPFAGAGTVGLVADRLNRDAILLELSPKYAEMARERIVSDAPLFADVEVSAFPPELVETCIKAGTSAKGACPECGAPWVRTVELTNEYREMLESKNAWRDDSGKPDGLTNRQPKGHPSQVPTKNRTTGWRPSCECGPAA